MSFGVPSLFSLASRERCMMNFKKLTVPVKTKPAGIPTATAAVLVPMCCAKNTPSLLYTVRSSNLRTNSGQIAFPGGKTDYNETPIQTALRETQEEIGLSPTRIDVWGHGPAVPGRDNKIMITPVVGTILDLKEDDLHINVKEVSEIFTVSIESLCNPDNQYHTQFRNGYILPVFVVDQHKIWGVTAYITHAFLSCLLSKDVYRNEWMKKRIVIKDQILENL